MISGVYRLASDFRVVCYETQWWSLVPLVSTGLVIYMMSVWAVLIVVLVQYRSKMDGDALQARAGLLFMQYRSEMRFWELVLLCKRTVAIILSAFPRPGMEAVQLFLLASLSFAGGCDYVCIRAMFGV
jgi:hypothetical protein